MVVGAAVAPFLPKHAPRAKFLFVAVFMLIFAAALHVNVCWHACTRKAAGCGCACHWVCSLVTL